MTTSRVSRVEVLQRHTESEAKAKDLAILASPWGLTWGQEEGKGPGGRLSGSAHTVKEPRCDHYHYDGSRSEKYLLSLGGP